ncbi:DUF4365 domain-containing protein [Burkholderia cepacia]|uniref:DUF4365 domain-containing protein n=1 Tax=Burkholderia cepacia TaxID=292 RepID=UPI00264BF7A1|nr:DUF4365 domain-containing protein [Burkholderia cepacia]MDN7861594.1 DUF4365 domain-containing protein [Burkholderia cepacia]
MNLPLITDTSELDELGMRLADSHISDDLGHIFRDKRKRDIGIDAEIEFVERDERTSEKRGTGRLIALQIKCGLSYFKEIDGESFVFRGEMKHLDYWLGHSLPVLILLCHPEERTVYWVEVTPSAVTRLSSGWKILVPKRNLLAKAKWELEAIASRTFIDDVIDLSLQTWLHARYSDRVEFAGALAMPRDYHWYRHLVQIGDDQVMVHWLYARYGVFDIRELREVLRLLPGNLTYGSKLLLFLIAESDECFQFDEEWSALCSAQKRVDVKKLIFDRNWPCIVEIMGDGKRVREYYKGEPIDWE